MPSNRVPDVPVNDSSNGFNHASGDDGAVDMPDDFELHAHELLSPEGGGPFAGWERSKRNGLALELLTLLEDRKHQVLLQVVVKKSMSSVLEPDKAYGFDWNDPWDLSLAMVLTMFEEHLRGPKTGSTSAGMVFIDHEQGYLDLVRDRCRARRASGGWRELKKVMEIGYSAVSHANAMIQMADLVAFTMKKSVESTSGLRNEWPEEAHQFFAECRDRIWPRVQYKQLSFNRLNVPADLVAYLTAVRKP